MIQPYKPDKSDLETDNRFPSGRWKGYFLQPHANAGRCWMQLYIEFFDGRLHGQGSDIVGAFVIKGEYALDTGGVRFQKHYPQYFVYYDGKHSGKAIAGIWHLPDGQDRFVIWHESVDDPTIDSLEAEAEVPLETIVLVN